MGMIYNPQTMRYEYTSDFYPNTSQPKNPSSQQGLIWVSGEIGAKSYIVPPNTTVLLMDSEDKRFYVKSSDNAGMPTIKTYRYEQIMNEIPTVNTQNVDNELNEKISVMENG